MVSVIILRDPSPEREVIHVYKGLAEPGGEIRGVVCRLYE